MDAANSERRRIISVDLLRGFTIFLMLFVNMVAGYRELPFLNTYLGSAPVSLFKHAEHGGEYTAEWPNYEMKHPAIAFRRAIILDYNKTDNTYNIAVLDKDEKTTLSIINNTTLRTPKPERPGVKVVAKVDPKTNAPRTFFVNGNGFTMCDWVAPFFVFVVGICIPISWRKRANSGWWRHVFTRTFLLIFLGIIYMSLAMQLSYWWGILQAIGVAYLLGALCVGFSIPIRVLIILVLGVFHAVMIRFVPWWTHVGDYSATAFKITNLHGDLLLPLNVHCTPWGSLGYGLCTIIGTLLGDAILNNSRKKIISTAIAIAILGIAGGLLVDIYQPISKAVVDTAYAYLASGVASLVFLLFYLVVDVCHITFWTPLFTVFGANALLAFFLQPLIRLPFQAMGLWKFFGGHSGWNGVLWGLIFVFLCWLVTLYCNKRKWYWKL